jgi:hypothetical protein
MSTQRPRRPCAVQGCKAWAKHGEVLCASHWQQARRHDPGVPELLKDVRQEAVQNDLALIQEELDRLLRAREEFRNWAFELRQRDKQDEDAGELKRLRIHPNQFLAAWERVTARIVQLIRARHQLLKEQPAQEDGLVEAVMDDILRQEVPHAEP